MSNRYAALMKNWGAGYMPSILLPFDRCSDSDSFGWGTARTRIDRGASVGCYTNNSTIKAEHFIAWMKVIDEVAPDLRWAGAIGLPPYGFGSEGLDEIISFCKRHTVAGAIGDVAWKNPRKADPPHVTNQMAWAANRIVKEELEPMEFHIAMTGSTMRVQIPTRLTLGEFADSDVIVMKLHESTPENAAVDVRERKLLLRLLEHPEIRIEPSCRERISDAVLSAKAVAVPIMPPTEFERIAYCEEESKMVCLNSWGPFKKGQQYDVTTMNYDFVQHYTRKKSHYNEKTGETSMDLHDCQLLGKDRKVRVFHGLNNEDFVDFMHQPSAKNPKELPEVNLWGIFAKPVVKTVLEEFPQRVKEIENQLNALEVLADMSFYPGQREYLKRVMCKDNALVAARTGTGKSLMTIATFCLKDARRCLIVCPKGTVSGGEGDEGEADALAQWVSEVDRFAPHIPVFTIFSYEDYKRILRQNGGKLPNGIFLTYYEAMFQNGGLESCPMTSGKPAHTDPWLYKLAGVPYPEGMDVEATEAVRSIGHESNGIRCVVSPCLSTLIGHEFDMVCLDEAHKLQNLTSNRTQMAIRLKPKYRYAFTATPVPNNATDLFAIMGWLCVPNWCEGGVCNAAFPFRREDESRFISQFLTKERDLTREAKYRAAKKKKGKSYSASPVLSAPARLLKILKPTIAYITKEQCNPDYIPPNIIDIRVPLGSQQAALYNYHTNPNNIKGKNALARFGHQVNALRAICTDPFNAKVNKEPAPRVRSNFNPKLLAILEIIRDRMIEGEQVVVINARTGINTELHKRLNQCGISVSRIDSTSYSGNHASEANLFKQGKTDVMLMGLRCAVGHSFDQCRHLIVGSIDYSPGPFEQAIGRVDRIASKGASIYCILNSNTIEELQFDTVAMKDDASKIILRGERVPRDFKPTDMSEVLVESIINWKKATPQTMDETICEERWPELRKQLWV